MPWSRRFDCLLPLALLALVQRVIKMIPPSPSSQSTKAEEAELSPPDSPVTCGGGRMGMAMARGVETQ